MKVWINKTAIASALGFQNCECLCKSNVNVNVNGSWSVMVNGWWVNESTVHGPHVYYVLHTTHQTYVQTRMKRNMLIIKVLSV